VSIQIEYQLRHPKVFDENGEDLSLYWYTNEEEAIKHRDRCNEDGDEYYILKITKEVL